MKRVTMEVSTRKVTILDDEPIDLSLDMVAKDKTSKSFLHETSISEEQTFGHREMVNHMVYQNRTVSGHPLYHMACPVFFSVSHYR